MLARHMSTEKLKRLLAEAEQFEAKYGRTPSSRTTIQETKHELEKRAEDE